MQQRGSPRVVPSKSPPGACSSSLRTSSTLPMILPVIDAFTRTGLFHLMVPREFGGSEADTDTILDVFEELAHQDGSIGWVEPH